MAMHFLGAMRGAGTLSSADGQSFGPAEYDIDGFLQPAGDVVASGELRMEAEALSLAFGRNDLRLSIEGGRVLSVRFSTRRSDAVSGAAHVDITEGLPPAEEWPHWHTLRSRGTPRR